MLWVSQLIRLGIWSSFQGSLPHFHPDLCLTSMNHQNHRRLQHHRLHLLNFYRTLCSLITWVVVSGSTNDMLPTVRNNYWICFYLKTDHSGLTGVYYDRGTNCIFIMWGIEYPSVDCGIRERGFALLLLLVLISSKALSWKRALDILSGAPFWSHRDQLSCLGKLFSFFQALHS